MTSLATTVKLIDDALALKYAGMTILTGDPPASTNVTVFIEAPQPEDYRELVYPSVSINLMSIMTHHEVSEGDEGESEEVGYDSGVSPNERLMRMNPEPKKIIYTIETLHKAKVGESRDLVHEAILSKTPDRGYITVKNIDGEDLDLWMLWTEGMGVANKDDVDADIVIYNKVLQVTVLAYIARVAYDNIDREKVAMNVIWTLFSRETVLTTNGIVIRAGGDVEDLEFEYDATTEGPV